MTILTGRRAATVAAIGVTVALTSSPAAPAEPAPAWMTGQRPAAANTLGSTQLVYSSSPFHTTQQIFTAHSDGTRLRRLTAAANVRDIEPVWSSDGDAIAFNRSFSPQPAGPGIFVMAADGTQQHRVVSGVLDLADWSPAGTQLLATADGAWPPKIVIIKLNGLERFLKVTQTDPRADAWSPDGDTIVYSSARNQHATSYNLFSIHPDGTPAARLTDDHGLDYDASYSRSGRRIVYTHTNPHGSDPAARTSHVYVMNSDGTTSRQLTTGTLQASAPHFTCNGAWVIFTGQPTPHTIRGYAVRPDSSHLHPLSAAITPLTVDPRPGC